MFKYSIMLNKKCIFTNIFIILQLTAVLVTSIITVSSIMSRVSDYIPLREILKSDGKCIYPSGMAPDNYYTINDILEENQNISEIYSIHINELINNDFESSSTFSYSKNMADLYIPKMKEGNWLNKTDVNSNVLEVVVANDKYKVGDIIKMTNSYNQDKEYDAKVIGILADDSKVLKFEKSTKENDPMDFRDLYLSPKNNCYFFLYEQLENKNIYQEPYGEMFAIFKDNLNANKILELNRNLAKYGEIEGLSDELNINSINYIKNDVILILPITICLLILTIICIIATISIQTKKDLKSYSILCICGATKKQCSIISLFISCINIVLSVIITVIFITIGRNLFLSDFIIDIGFWQLFFCLAIMIFYISISMITPFLMIRKVQPIDVLKSE